MVLGIYIITIILSVLALFFSLSKNMFGLFDDPTHVQFASFAMALLIIFIGDRLASLLSGHTLLENISQMINDKFNKVPHINVIKEFSTSDDAMKYIASRVQDCKVILNTKISKEAIQPRRDIGLLYMNAVKKALKNGLVYRDIISPGFENYSEELKEYSVKCDGNYEYRLQESTSSSFLNFIILDFGDEEELVLGWATSFYMGPAQKAFKIKDKRIISYFKGYHHSLADL